MFLGSPRQPPLLVSAMKKKSGRDAKEAAQEAAAEESEEAMDLLGDGDEEDDAPLKVSASFAKKYNEKKDKQELARARRILADEDADGSSDSDAESEDEGGKLLTDKVAADIFETLRKIKNKDPSIYDKSAVFFDEKDFESGKVDTEGKAKPVRYADFLRDTLLNEGAEALENEEEGEDDGTVVRKKTSKDEEQELRQTILAAAHGEGASDDEGDLFTLKKKTKSQKLDEDEAYQDFRRQRLEEAHDVAQYWKEGEELDDNERFLRDFILNKSWQETASLQPKAADGSESEASHLEQVDEFEKDYNFRFEMEDGGLIQGHKRFQEASVREKNDKRKRQRKAQAERKDTDKIRRVEELKRLKNLKKQEIKRRLQQLAEVTGNEEMPLGKINLDADFDPDEHDKEMSTVFDEQFDEADEDLDEEELVKAPAGLADLDVSNEAEEIVKKHRGRSQRVVAQTGAEEEWQEDWQQEKTDEVEVEDDNHDAGPADPEEWWLCDECQKGIPGGKKRFDCTVCENYTLCPKCFRIRRHPHKFVRRKVPDASMPPEDFKGVAPNRESVDKVLDEYFQLDYEDIIGGDLPTRFKYTKVTANDCGMSSEQILAKTDQELNRIVPLKKLRTYRTDNAKVRKEARWRARGGREEADDDARQKTRPTGSTLDTGDGGISSTRLSAYRLHEDRRYKGKGKKGEGGKRDKGSSKS